MCVYTCRHKPCWADFILLYREFAREPSTSSIQTSTYMTKARQTQTSSSRPGRRDSANLVSNATCILYDSALPPFGASAQRPATPLNAYDVCFLLRLCSPHESVILAKQLHSSICVVCSWTCQVVFHMLFKDCLAYIIPKTMEAQHLTCINTGAICYCESSALAELKFSSSHRRTPFFETIPSSRSFSSGVRGLYKRMMYPHTLHTSSHSASNSSHQQFSGCDGSAIWRNRVVKSIAAHTMVGTAYSAYTGVCSLSARHKRTASEVE